MTNAAIVMSSGRTVLKEIDAASFQHPLDRQAIAQLKKIQGFDTFMAKFMEYGVDRLDYVLNIATNIRVGPRQMSKLYAMLQESCAVLDVPQPELYVGQGGVNAFTSGHNNPYIILMTGLLDLMNDDEVMAVIAHELGHIKCGHVLYKSMAQWIGFAGALVGEIGLGIGNIVIKPIEAGLLAWDRRSELSADRAAMLVVQDARPCITMLMKLAGGTNRMADQLDPEEFLNQAKAYGEDLDRTLGNRFYRFLAGAYRGTHPFIIERAKALNDWMDSPECDQILKGNYLTQAQRPKDGHCPKCGRPAHPTNAFCGGCGLRLR